MTAQEMPADAATRLTATWRGKAQFHPLAITIIPQRIIEDSVAVRSRLLQKGKMSFDVGARRSVRRINQFRWSRSRPKTRHHSLTECS